MKESLGEGLAASQGHPPPPPWSLGTIENFQVSYSCSMCHIHQGLNAYLCFLPDFILTVGENYITYFSGLCLLENLQVANKIL